MASCANDNYAEPNSGIEGTILDATTLKPVPQAIEAGASPMFKMYEKADSSKTYITFNGKIDGTFKNSWIFSTDFLMTIEQTNFFPIDPISVTLVPGKITKMDILVIPFVRIDTLIATINQTIGSNDSIATRSLDFTYRMSRDSSAYKISSISYMWHVSPYIDNAIGNSLGIKSVNVARKLESDLVNKDLVFSIDLLKETEFLKPANLAIIRSNGNKIYVRVSAMDNTHRKPNYSVVVPVIIPFIDNELK